MTETTKQTPEFLRFNTFKEELVCETSSFQVTNDIIIVVNWIERNISAYTTKGEFLATFEQT